MREALCNTAEKIVNNRWQKLRRHDLSENCMAQFLSNVQDSFSSGVQENDTGGTSGSAAGIEYDCILLPE